MRAASSGSRCGGGGERRAAPGGFTLVGLQLALALTALLMALALPFVHAQKRIWERQEESREARRALVGALALVTRDLEQAGYHTAGPPLRSLEAESLSYVLSRDERDLGVALIDVGGGTTDLAVFERGALWHTAVLPVGGDHFTNDQQPRRATRYAPYRQLRHRRGRS